jgi:hypothetical protein
VVKTGGFVYYVPQTATPSSPCPTRFTASSTGSPILTRADGERYMLGITIPSATTARRTVDTATWMLSGASLTYTCPTGCQ